MICFLVILSCNNVKGGFLLFQAVNIVLLTWTKEYYKILFKILRSIFLLH